jgi:anti-sigma factor RsiW
MRLRTRFWRPSTDCREVGRRLQSYLDGELDDGADEIAAHLDACRACGLELETYREVKASLSREQPPVAPDALDRLRSFGDELVTGEVADPPTDVTGP